MVAVKAVEEASPRVVLPVTVSVPPILSLPVTVEVPTVAVVAARLVIVAFVVVEFPTIRLVIEASVATKEEKNPLVEVALVENRLVAVIAEAEALVSVV